MTFVATYLGKHIAGVTFITGTNELLICFLYKLCTMPLFITTAKYRDFEVICVDILIIKQLPLLPQGLNTNTTHGHYEI